MPYLCVIMVQFEVFMFYISALAYTKVATLTLTQV